MQIPPFKIERYFAQHEFSAPYLLACSDCESYFLKDLLALEPGAAERFENLWLGYTESTGDPQLRAEIAGLYTHTRAEQMLVHAGGEEPIFNFMNVALTSGDHVIVHYPCYQSLHEIARSLGCEVTFWQGRAADGWALDLDDLERHLRPNTRVVIVNCPHNPTGYVMPVDDLQALTALSAQHGFIVYSDEVYRLLEHDPACRLPNLSDIDERARFGRGDVQELRSGGDPYRLVGHPQPSACTGAWRNSRITPPSATAPPGSFWQLWP